MSLTTYGARVKTVHLALESISRGLVRPSRLILWLSPPESGVELIAPLRRLQRRGLEVRFTSDIGPHKKYYPYVCGVDDFFAPLVTADDDMLYPAAWLSDLTRSYEAFPDVISAHRAHVVSVGVTGILPYSSWASCESAVPSLLNFATGASGILYPPSFLSFIRDAGDEFMERAPRGDDIWLHHLAVRSRTAIRQVSASSADYASVPGTVASGLFSENVGGGQNDVQIAKTYGADEVVALQRARDGL